MMNYLNYFFNLNHLFSLRPQAMQLRAVMLLATLFLTFSVFSFVIWFVLPKIKDALKVKAWRRLFHLLITMGIIGWVYLFFAWQGVALLGARFWLLLWAVVCLVWLGFIAKYYFVQVSKMRKDIDEKRKFEKYLP